MARTKINTDFFILILLSMTQGHNSFLKADGKRIINEKGESVLLRGMGLGGWMLQEGYMMKVRGQGQQHKIRSRIPELIGAEKTEEFYSAWLSNHTRKIDIDSMKAWGFNSVRLPMHYELIHTACRKGADKRCEHMDRKRISNY